MFNQGLADEIIGRIEANPQSWHQGNWARKTECGTTFCIAGWACVLSDVNIFWSEDSYLGQANGSFEDMATELLGLTQEQANTIFYCMTEDIDVIKSMFKDIANGEW